MRTEASVSHARASCDAHVYHHTARGTDRDDRDDRTPSHRTRAGIDAPSRRRHRRARGAEIVQEDDADEYDQLPAQGGCERAVVARGRAYGAFDDTRRISKCLY